MGVPGRAQAVGADQCPSTAAGTSLAVKALLNASFAAAVYGTASNYADEVRQRWRCTPVGRERPCAQLACPRMELSRAGWAEHLVEPGPQAHAREDTRGALTHVERAACAHADSHSALCNS